MANLRDIRNRINSVENTKQVTRAMKMVAAAKLRKAQERIFNTRPYAFKIREIVDHLQDELDPTAHEFFQQREEIEGVLLVIITADRGLAGAFNTNVIKKAEETIEKRYKEQKKAGNLYLLCPGRKGHEHFEKRDYQIVGDYRHIFDGLSFNTARSIVEDSIEGFRRGLWDEVDLVYNEFKNTIAQNRITEPLLPIPEGTFQTPVMEDASTGDGVLNNGQEIDYIFEPGAVQILDELVPRYLNYQVWRALLESNAAEQGARMVAMDNATSNAEDLLEDLRITYNRERQNAITMEILDITSGAEALGGG